jgi:hypothetical protein
MNFLLNFLLGITFGFGLILSQSFKPTTIIGFLNWNENWNPFFLFLVIGMISVTSMIFFSEQKLSPAHRVIIRENKKTKINIEVMLGTVMFGTGLGISGLCVSTAIINLAFGEWQSILFFLFMMAGFYCPKFIKKITL